MAMVRNKNNIWNNFLKPIRLIKKYHLSLVIIVFLIRVIIPLQLYTIKKQ